MTIAFSSTLALARAAAAAGVKSLASPDLIAARVQRCYGEGCLRHRPAGMIDVGRGVIVLLPDELAALAAAYVPEPKRKRRKPPTRETL